jgi:3-dehydroquinate synthase
MNVELLVPLPGRPYRILVSNLEHWDDLPLPELSWTRAVLVTDDRVGPLWASPVREHLSRRGVVIEEIRIPEGERSKDFDRMPGMYESFLHSGLARDDCVIALGGGVVGDLAGFAAATYLRGCDLVQIPTSLLAMVDSSVGGKVGVNFGGSKNMIGAFHQPKLVLTAPGFLTTLSDRHLANGIAEALKAGMIGDPDLVDLLENRAEEIWGRVPDVLAEMILRSVAVKARIVAEDEREHGQRMLLNLGHTVGHALESGTEFRLLHGEAVAIGLVAECQLSVILGIASETHRDRVERIIEKHRLPTRIEGLQWETILPFLNKDKKIRDRGWTCVLTGGMGDARVLHQVPRTSVREAVTYVLA